MQENYKLIFYGLGGSFGGARNVLVVKDYTDDEADIYLHDLCSDMVQSYSIHFKNDFDEIEEYEDEEYELAYNEIVEKWASGYVLPYNEENVKKALGKNYENEFLLEMHNDGILAECEKDYHSFELVDSNTNI